MILMLLSSRLPVALEKIKWKSKELPLSIACKISDCRCSAYLIFTIWDSFECVMIYFFVVETKGLTLEEISEVFEQ